MIIPIVYTVLVWLHRVYTNSSNGLLSSAGSTPRLDRGRDCEPESQEEKKRGRCKDLYTGESNMYIIKSKKTHNLVDSTIEPNTSLQVSARLTQSSLYIYICKVWCIPYTPCTASTTTTTTGTIA